MTDAEARRLREEFLTSLDAAMTELPYRVATDIRQGIDEELSGLDAMQTAERIGRMGAPESIAREAAAEISPAALVSVAPAKSVGVGDSKGFAIAAALVLAFGGLLIPVVGWFAGVVLVAMSTRWRRWEKLVAILTPIATLLFIAGVTVIVGLISPAATEPVNPLVPALYDIGFSAIWGMILLTPACGLWLLWRLRAPR